MEVKIGNKIYSGDDEPIMVILNDKDKENISKMNSKSWKYCVHPNNMPREKVAEFMGIVSRDISKTGKA